MLQKYLATILLVTFLAREGTRSYTLSRISIVSYSPQHPSYRAATKSIPHVVYHSHATACSLVSSFDFHFIFLQFFLRLSVLQMLIAREMELQWPMRENVALEQVLVSPLIMEHATYA